MIRPVPETAETALVSALKPDLDRGMTTGFMAA